MYYLKSAIVLAVAAVLIGCGGQKDSISRGDRFIATTEFRMRADIEGSNESFAIVIPEGTIMEVAYAPRPGSSSIEVIPVATPTNNNVDQVLESFVPSHISNRAGATVRYTIALKQEDLGTSFEKHVK